MFCMCISLGLLSTGYFVLQQDGIPPCVPAWADPILASVFRAQLTPAPLRNLAQEMRPPSYFRVGSGAGSPMDVSIASTADPSSASAVAGEFKAAFHAIRRLRSQDLKLPWGTLRNASASTALRPNLVPLRFPVVSFARTLIPTFERLERRLRNSVEHEREHRSLNTNDRSLTSQETFPQMSRQQSRGEN